ncbi:hypothetical protein L226DRAFT_525834 [Lentinus tigrinus ALCF2SS1-7]|uniref:Uncharacterized protein n=1 Tax=Lentinus tigrinus ALCF2SS1-6 TaxID=1328759 RepID=A0A5C2RS68_9APHY|nr:hypothetical protein L227DRAFT_567759 [Lentinus tigrinus ALCF2SS1-6]RPD70534.1 hypothetical protein L226DRAFT_525834 [Lentinus tigrinus ALCF2SS1-7]
MYRRWFTYRHRAIGHMSDGGGRLPACMTTFTCNTVGGILDVKCAQEPGEDRHLYAGFTAEGVDDGDGVLPEQDKEKWMRVERTNTKVNVQSATLDEVLTHVEDQVVGEKDEEL